MEKLIIKIKMPSPSAMELHFKCSLCEKTFSNGKALGGHKRWHLVKGKSSVETTESNLTTTRNEPKISSSSKDHDLTSDDAKKLTCPICDKAFISDRSLHGHMKKHPERNWRGMIPPPTTREEVENGDNLLADDDKSGDGDEGENDEWFVRDDLLTAGWPVTGKRGRLGKAPVNPPAPSVLDQSTGLSFDLNEFPPEYSS